jgi:CheY-like chemotaxis protein
MGEGESRKENRLTTMETGRTSQAQTQNEPGHFDWLCHQPMSSAWPDCRKIAGLVMESIARVDGLSAPAPHIELHVASDGAEAMDFLNREGEHANAPRPDLISLDLDLPKNDGREVLKEIKESPTLKSIPRRLTRISWGVIDSMRAVLTLSLWASSGSLRS